MLDPGSTVDWLNHIRTQLYPDHGPAHIFVVPHCTVPEDRYEDVVGEIADLAAGWKAFDFEVVGMCYGKPHGCVAIRVCDEDNILKEIMREIRGAEG
ncbi:hypothetical protein B0H13DRAFT_2325169 [Mycena leptocephala]|nr:hypothetical protein B0H13DRAFT_2325169 [Mycena leptocephala]